MGDGFTTLLFCVLQLKPSTKEAAKALGPDRVPENQKREVYERVRRAVEAKGGVCTQHKVHKSLYLLPYRVQ